MKKVLGVLCAFLALAAFAPRPASAASIDLGFKGGLSLSNLNWTGGGPADEYCNLNKPVFGAFLAFNLDPTFAVQPEVYLWQGGACWEEEYEGYEYRADLIFTYIHVPVLAKVHLIKEGKVRPILFAGPAVSFLTKAVQKFYEDGVLMEEDDIKEYLKGTDISAVLGGGLELTLSKIMLVLDVRYNLGFTNINNKGDETSIKNKAIMIMAGIGF
jgi:hypothetical protein